jgi:hypothetical protein
MYVEDLDTYFDCNFLKSWKLKVRLVYESLFTFFFFLVIEF